MDNIDEMVNLYKDNRYRYEQFLIAVRAFFESHPALHNPHLPIIHSIKSRLKDSDHLRDKLVRKLASGKEITTDNLFQQITDFAGIRVLHLYQEQFVEIHKAILEKIDEGDWCFAEPPVAYTWDKESEKFFDDLQIRREVKESYYTSIHYLIRPNNTRSFVCCEIQVRTLFEEIWGEIDHTINYPHSTDSVACLEQLRVLSKLASTGTRLADAIFRSFDEYQQKIYKTSSL